MPSNHSFMFSNKLAQLSYTDTDRLYKVEKLAEMGSFQWDADTDTLECSNHLYHIFGYEPYHINLTFTFLLSHLNRPCRRDFLNALNKHTETGEELQFLEIITRHDGSKVKILCSIQPVLKPDGTLQQVIGVCRDITEFYEKDRLLSNQKAFFEAILDHMPALILVADRKGEFLHFNDTFKKTFGTEGKPLTSIRDVSKISQESFSFLIEPNHQPTEHKEVICSERWLTFCDGTRRNFRFVKIPLIDKSNIQNKLQLTIAVDQTEEFQQKETTVMNEARLKIASEVGKFGILDWNLETGEVICNDMYYQVIGTSKEHYTPNLNNYFNHLLLEEDKPKVLEMISKIKKGEVIAYEIEYRIKSPQKGIVWILHRGSIIKQNNKPHRQVGVLQDITFKRNYEDQITDTNKRLTNIIKTAPGAIFKCHCTPGMAMVKVSKQVKSITGYRPKEFAPKGTIDFESIITENDRGLNRTLLDQVIKKGEGVFQNTVRIVHKQGVEKWMWIKAQITQNKRKESFIEGFLVDITDQVNTEDRVMSATLQAEDNQRQKISEEIHDGLQQTLISSLMNLQNLSDKIAEKAPDLLEQFEMSLKTLKAGVEETRNIAHTIMPKSIEDFGLIKTIEQVIYQMNQNCDTTFRLIENLNDRRLMKKTEVSLYRIFQEAINNILKHAEANEVIVQLVMSKHAITMTVEDDGKGFDNLKIDFLKSGFGLSSMRSRAGALSGAVDISSKKGVGTSIMVEIPLGQ